LEHAETNLIEGEKRSLGPTESPAKSTRSISPPRSPTRSARSPSPSKPYIEQTDMYLGSNGGDYTSPLTQNNHISLTPRSPARSARGLSPTRNPSRQARELSPARSVRGEEGHKRLLDPQNEPAEVNCISPVTQSTQPVPSDVPPCSPARPTLSMSPPAHQNAQPYDSPAHSPTVPKQVTSSIQQTRSDPTATANRDVYIPPGQSASRADQIRAPVRVDSADISRDPPPSYNTKSGGWFGGWGKSITAAVSSLEEMAEPQAPPPQPAKPTLGWGSSAPKPASAEFSFGSGGSASAPRNTGFGFGGGLPPKPSDTEFDFGGKPSSKPSETGFGFGGGLPPKPSETGFGLGGSLPPKPSETSSGFGGHLPPKTSDTRFRFGSGLPPKPAETAFAPGVSRPPKSSETGFEFGGNLPSKPPQTKDVFEFSRSAPKPVETKEAQGISSPKESTDIGLRQDANGEPGNEDIEGSTPTSTDAIPDTNHTVGAIEIFEPEREGKVTSPTSSSSLTSPTFAPFRLMEEYRRTLRLQNSIRKRMEEYIDEREAEMNRREEEAKEALPKIQEEKEATRNTNAIMKEMITQAD
ncbi:4472_t:CDS:2, partial [Acaulospora colombiana]